MSLSVVIPTIGRKTLPLLLNELIPHLDGLDEVILVSDGKNDAILREVVTSGFKTKVRYMESLPSKIFGNYQRDVGVALARGSNIWFIDDDDKPENVPAIKKAIKEEPNHVHIFQLEVPPVNSGIVYTGMPPKNGNLATGMVVVPNDKTKLRRWEFFASDWGYIIDTIAAFDGVVRYHQEVVVRGRAWGEELRMEKLKLVS